MLITNYLLRFKLQQNIFPLLGIDLGTAFTGFSITYNLKNLQIYDLHYSNCYSPNDATLYKKIISIIKKEKIGGIVIGKPEKKSKQHVKDFTTEFTEGLISNLQSQNLTTYVTQINEDNTTIQAQRISKSKEKFLNDGLASLLILQRFLNSYSVPQYPIQISQDIIPPTLKQINGLSQQHSISPIRKSGDDLNIQKLPNKFDQLHSTLSSNPLKRDETISITKPEIEKLNAIIKIKTQQNQELQARISELELHYSLKQQDQESNHLYHQELAQTQIRSLQQEIIALQTQINQFSQSTLKFEQLLQQTQQENNSLREKLKNNTNNNELNVVKQEVISLNQQIIKANEVITSLEDQNKYYEQEYSKYIKENQNLQQKTDILTQQISNVKQEYDLIQEKLKQTEFKYSQQSKELEQTIEKLSKPQFESQNNNKMKQSQQQEIQQLTLQLTYKQQEIKTINDLNQQLKLQHEEQNQNLQNLQIVVERQNIQIGQLRKTIQLLEQNMQSSSQTDASYQQLLLNYNNLKEQLKNQSSSEIITLSNNQSLQHQLKLSQQQSQQQQTQIDKLKTMLKNRLDEIELWKTKCYQSETQAQITNQLITENEALREKFRQLEIEKGNQFASQEIQQLNQIINQQQEQLQLYKEKLFGNGNSNQIQEKQKKQMSSPKNSRYTLLEPNVKEFNSKKY